MTTDHSRLAHPPKISVESENAASVRISQKQHEQLRQYCFETRTNVVSATAFILDEFFKFYQLTTGKPLVPSHPPKAASEVSKTVSLRVSEKQHLLLRAFCLEKGSTIAAAMGFIFGEFFDLYERATGKRLLRDGVLNEALSNYLTDDTP